MKIRNVNFGEKPLFLAPMAGVSDVGFREEAVKFGADVTYTEMLSARAMAHNPKKTDLMTITSPLERLTIAQIFGHESEYLVKALENEMLDKQRTVVSQIATLLSEEVSRKAQFFSVFADLHTDFGGHPFINKEDIDYLREKNPEITHISVLNPNGRLLFYSSDDNSRFSYALELGTILRTCVDNGKEYVGSINRDNGHLYAMMAFPLREHRTDKEVIGVLVAEMDYLHFYLA